jgi:hypothetical protein
MIAEITTERNSPKTIDLHHRGNSPAVDFRMQWQCLYKGKKRY